MRKSGDLNWEGLVSPLLIVVQIRDAALSMKIVPSDYRHKCVTSLTLQLMDYMVQVSCFTLRPRISATG